MKGLLLVLAMSMILFAFGDTETVTNVRGVQRENSKLVDIYYDLNATDYGTYTVGVEIEGRTVTVNASTFTGDVGEGITPGTNRHILWDAGTDWPNKKGEVKTIVTATKEDPTVSHGKVQLWEGGPYWADRNIGASAPEDYGLYFWWGDTTGHRPSSDGTFSFSFDENNPAIYTCDKSESEAMGVSDLQSAGWVTIDRVLVPAHDAAHVKWGGSWRMPTYRELYALLYDCDWTQTTMNGVNGRIVRGRGAYASNSIFLPAAGYGDRTSLGGAGWLGCYWSSVPTTWWSSAWSLYFEPRSSGTEYGYYFRENGLSIRPVQDSTK